MKRTAPLFVLALSSTTLLSVLAMTSGGCRRGDRGPDPETLPPPIIGQQVNAGDEAVLLVSGFVDIASTLRPIEGDDPGRDAVVRNQARFPGVRRYVERGTRVRITRLATETENMARSTVAYANILDGSRSGQEVRLQGYVLNGQMVPRYMTRAAQPNGGTTTTPPSTTTTPPSGTTRPAPAPPTTRPAPTNAMTRPLPPPAPTTTRPAPSTRPTR